MQLRNKRSIVLKSVPTATLFWLITSLGAAAQPYIFWTDPGVNAIGRANADGSSANNAFLTGYNASGIAANDTHIFWTNLNGYIVRANHDGSNPDTLLSSLPAPGGIAVNSTHIFWVTQNSSPVNIGRANLDGTSSNGNLLAIPDLPTTVFGLAANDTHLYWGDCGATEIRDTIGRAEVDGSNADHDFITGGSCSTGLFLTPTDLYWANAGSTTIGNANPDGTSVNQNFVTGANRPGGTVVTSSHLFWTNQNSGSIGRANTDGSSPDQDFITSPSFPIWITGQPIAPVLPVELVSLEVVPTDLGFRLEWETISETNNAGFAIQQTCTECDSDAWKTIGFVEGHGTTSDANRYNFDVADLHPGRHAFRLKQIDFDGTFEYSSVVEVFVELSGSHLLTEAYPNPFSTATSLTLTIATDQQLNVDLFDTIGRRLRRVYQGPTAAAMPLTFKVSAHDIPAGIYVLRAEGEHFVESRRLVVVD